MRIDTREKVLARAASRNSIYARVRMMTEGKVFSDGSPFPPAIWWLDGRKLVHSLGSLFASCQPEQADYS